jgi:predicted ATPase with chaperone activity
MWIGKIRPLCRLQDEGSTLRPKGVSTGQTVVRAAMSPLNFSARANHRILKLARKIIDLAGSEEIQVADLLEALHLR